MIRARIRKSFPDRADAAAFSLDVDLEAAAGITVLFGPSGSGKTLTLDCIAGFVRPDEGRILVDDELLFDGAARVQLPPRKRRCGYVFQNDALFPHMTLRKNLEFALERRPGLGRHRRVNEMLEKFRLADLSGRRPHELSGGQKQRCSIARALIGNPRLLLLDEPTRGLDASLRTELYDVLRQVRNEFETPALLVTHDFDECFTLGDQMVVIREGRIVQTGTPRKVFEQPANVEVAKLMGRYNLMPVEIRGLDPSRNTSRLRYQEFELTGPYFPGRLIGDRVWLCTQPEELVAMPRDGKPGPNQIPAVLNRLVEKPQRARLEFVGEIAVELEEMDFEEARNVKEWVIGFPQHGMRLI